MKKKIELLANKYTYRLEWSEEDKVYIGRCLELPSLVVHGNSQESALKEIKFVALESLKWLKKDNEEIPLPIWL